MKRLYAWLAICLGALCLLVLLGLGAAYTRVAPAFEVPRTVTDDPSLPRLLSGGVALHVEAFGDPQRPVVIVLHGGPGDDSRSMLALKALADEYRVVFFDQRGTGLSERVDAARLTLDAQYGDLDAVVAQQAPGGRVHLVGHSWGAMLAAGWAARHPERVGGLVLAEPGLLTDEAGAAFLEKAGGLKPRASLKNLALVLRAYLESLHLEGPDAQALADYRALRVFTSPEIEGHPLAGYWCGGDLRTAALPHWRFGALAADLVRRQGMDEEGHFHVDFTTGLGRVTQEVLLLAGSCDRILGEAHQRRFHLPLFAHPTLVVIDGAGHTLFGEKPAESVAAVRAYLGRVRPDESGHDAGT